MGVDGEDAEVPTLEAGAGADSGENFSELTSCSTCKLEALTPQLHNMSCHPTFKLVRCKL